MARIKRYRPSQAIPPFNSFRIPKDHLIINVRISQEGGSIDKEQAIKILRTRPYAAKIINTLKYRGATSIFHVFSYPDPHSKR